MSDTPRDNDVPPPPDFIDSLKEVGEAGRAAYGSARDTGRAMRALVSADFALARSAFGRALAWACVAIVFGASAWLLITGALIALMQRFGFSWLQSLSLAAFISLAMTAFAAWRVGRYFDYTGMHATRRQLSRLGLFDENGNSDDDEALPASPPPGNGGP
ncbi:phage holin family protein [Pseudoxanthomonas sp. LH2527]|uniref:phage holin family protein n=1 Tax=Pseudoxanthomonas sp. LH2527 TaxID=2923249 RepID=UPI001F14439F|nr:phage holin family protein [Pseudoxanthomonas sp. LH2527]